MFKAATNRLWTAGSETGFVRKADRHVGREDKVESGDESPHSKDRPLHHLAILTTHPIQYQVPWFRKLAALPDVDLTVFFCQIPDAAQQGDGFGVEFQWDLPLLDGYHYEVLRNVAARPSVTEFRGCDTPEIGRRIRQGGFDAVLVNGWVVKSCLQALRACRRYGVPCIVRGESNALRPRPWWKGALHRLLLRQYAALLYIGRSNADFYRKHGVPQERLFPARYCVDNEWFAAAADRYREQRTAIRAAWNIPEESVVFVFCAKFIEKKRPMDFLKAAALAAGRGAPLHVLLVGDGELRPACEKFVAEAGVGATFAGFLNQTEIPKAYAAADCLVLPSDYGETWGLVVNEAMACGLPAVVSDRVGCAPDLIMAGETGYTFPLGNTDSLAEHLVSMSQDPDHLRTMGDTARQHVAAYSFDAVVQGVRDAVAFVQRPVPQPFSRHK